MKLDRICSFCHWKNPSPSFLAGISKICLWNWIIHKKRRDLCQTTFVNTRIYIYISNCVSKCFQIMKTLNNTHTPPPSRPPYNLVNANVKPPAKYHPKSSQNRPNWWIHGAQGSLPFFAFHQGFHRRIEGNDVEFGTFGDWSKSTLPPIMEVEKYPPKTKGKGTHFPLPWIMGG